ncbi:MAG: hypothetical protein ACKOOG_03225, partial [Actinomycetota bacterium]
MNCVGEVGESIQPETPLLPRTAQAMKGSRGAVPHCTVEEERTWAESRPKMRAKEKFAVVVPRTVTRPPDPLIGWRTPAEFGVPARMQK